MIYYIMGFIATKKLDKFQKEIIDPFWGGPYEPYATCKRPRYSWGILGSVWCVLTYFIGPESDI